MRPWKNTIEQRKLMLNYQSVNNFVKTVNMLFSPKIVCEKLT